MYKLETGDLLLFEPFLTGNEFFGKCIAWWTGSKFAHCGMVIRNPNFTPEPLRGLYILESTGFENVPDCEDDKIKFGVQLRKLEEVVKNYSGQIWVRKLTCERDADFYKKLKKAHSMVHNLPYDIGFDYIKAAFRLKIGQLQRKDTFFCSALVTYLYVSLGVLPSQTDWTIVTPKNLSSEPKSLKDINLLWFCPLSEETKIDNFLE